MNSEIMKLFQLIKKSADDVKLFKCIERLFDDSDYPNRHEVRTASGQLAFEGLCF